MTQRNQLADRSLQENVTSEFKVNSFNKLRCTVSPCLRIHFMSNYILINDLQISDF